MELEEEAIERTAGTEIYFNLSNSETKWLIRQLQDELDKDFRQVGFSVLLDKHDVRNGNISPIISLQSDYLKPKKFSVIIGGWQVKDSLSA